LVGRAARAETEPMSEQQGMRVGYRAAFASRELRALVAGQLVSIAGTSVAAVALTILVYKRTASPLLASLAFALGFVPYLLGGALLSGIVDRVRPRRLVASCDLVAAILAAGMAWPGLPIGVLFALLLAIGTLASVEGGARAALLRASVSAEAYVPARSLLRISGQLAQIGGNAAGGALLLVLTPSGTLLANAASFAVSAATARFCVADHPNTGARSPTTLFRDSLRGARTILAHAELRRLLLVSWLVPMFSVAPEALAAPYVASRHGSPALVGWWLVALPAGIIIGDIVGVRFLDARQQRALVGPAAAASFLPYLAFAAGPSIPVALPLLLGSGLCGLYALASAPLRARDDALRRRADDLARRRVRARRRDRPSDRTSRGDRDRWRLRPPIRAHAPQRRSTTITRHRPPPTAAVSPRPARSLKSLKASPTDSLSAHWRTVVRGGRGAPPEGK
jgi:MFS family permease